MFLKWKTGYYIGQLLEFRRVLFRSNYLEVLRAYGGSWIDGATLAVGLDRPEAIAALEVIRSEERRVGKEWRYRGGADEWKRKKEERAESRAVSSGRRIRVRTNGLGN